MHIDPDDTRIRRHRKTLQTRIVGRRIALEHDRLSQLACRRLDLRDQIEPVCNVFQRWQEYMEITLTCLQRHRRAHKIATFMPGIRQPLLTQAMSLKGV